MNFYIHKFRTLDCTYVYSSTIFVFCTGSENFQRNTDRYSVRKGVEKGLVSE